MILYENQGTTETFFVEKRFYCGNDFKSSLMILNQIQLKQIILPFLFLSFFFQVEEWKKKQAVLFFPLQSLFSPHFCKTSSRNNDRVDFVDVMQTHNGAQEKTIQMNEICWFIFQLILSISNPFILSPPFNSNQIIP